MKFQGKDLIFVKKKIAHVVPHSHWDREWRYPIWQNRSLLVDFIDELLETLERVPEYKQFNMDGQAVIFEDYLEIRPEKREQIEKYIKEGRITAGPWYTLPDLYPIDGECLVRNLLKGYRVSEKLGQTMKIAYTSFGWGQTAQFPQIYKGFGIDFCITAKRVSLDRAPKSEFWWESPDGSRILTTRLGKGGRSQLFEFGITAIRRGRKNDKDMHYRWNEGGLIYHKANAGEEEMDHFIFDDNKKFYPEQIGKNFEDMWTSTDESVSDNVRLFLLGCDFAGAEPDVDRFIAEANKAIKDKDFELSTLQDYIKDLKDDIDTNTLMTVYGELRDGPSAACSGNALATRIYIKQKNKKVQNMLIYRAEPLMSAMRMLGDEYDEKFSQKTWEFLLKSHPHDSINGVTQDKTVDDEMYHLAQAEELSDILYQRGMRNFIRNTDLSGYDKNDILLMVYNPLSFDRDEIIKVSADIPSELDAWDLKVTDDEGKPADIQPIEIQELWAGINDSESRPSSMPCDRHIFYLHTGTIPAGGCRIYKLEPNRTFERSFVCGIENQDTSRGLEISKTAYSMENEYIKFEVNPNGTVKLTDKKLGKTYDNLHYFEETGEVGDYWINLRPHNNRTYTTIANNADVWVENNGELSATIGVRHVMRVPKESIRPHCFHAADSKRSDDYKDMEIISYFTLKKGEKKVDVRIEADNVIRDHRVRVMYPTGIKAENSYAAGHFNVDERPVMPQGDKEYWVDMQTLPQQTFVDVTDKKTGLAFVNNSLTEFEIRNDGEGTLALTLFRGVKNTICTDKRLDNYYPKQHGGQSLGKRTCEYAIYPHSGDWDEGKVYEQAEKFNVVPAVMQTAAHSFGSVKPNTSLYKIESKDLVMSAFKKAEDRDTLIMRLFNPTDREISSLISLYKAPKKAYFTNMNEERQEEFDISKPIKVAKHKIVTMEFEM